jgi:hypothetical protein
MIDPIAVLAGSELSWWGGRQRCSGEAEADRRSDTATTARLSEEVAVELLRPHGQRRLQRFRIGDRETAGPTTATLPVRHMSGSPGLLGFGDPFPRAEALGYTPMPLAGLP